MPNPEEPIDVIPAEFQGGRDRQAARMNTTLFWVAGGVAAFCLLCGCLVLGGILIFAGWQRTPQQAPYNTSPQINRGGTGQDNGEMEVSNSFIRPTEEDLARSARERDKLKTQWGKVEEQVLAELRQNRDQNDKHVQLRMERFGTMHISCLAVAPDSSIAAIGDGEEFANPPKRSIKLVDLKTFKEIRTVTTGKNHFEALLFTLDGKALISAEEWGPIRLWDVESGKETRTIEAKTVQYLELAPDGKTFASAGYADYAENCIWDVSTGKKVLTLYPKNFYASGLAYSPDGRMLALAGNRLSENPYEVHNWDLVTGRESRTLTVSRSEHAVYKPFRALAFSTDSRRLVLACEIREKPEDKPLLQIWDPVNGVLVKNIENPPKLYSLAFSPDGKILVGGGIVVRGDKNAPDIEGKEDLSGVVVYDGTTFERQRSFGKEIWSNIAIVRFSEAGSLFFTVASHGTLNAWDSKDLFDDKKADRK
jgi:WD40 repeat protein